MFRDAKDALERLESALLEQETPETEYDDDPSEVLPEPEDTPRQTQSNLGLVALALCLLGAIICVLGYLALQWGGYL